MCQLLLEGRADASHESTARGQRFGSSLNLAGCWHAIPMHTPRQVMTVARLAKQARRMGGSFAFLICRPSTLDRQRMQTWVSVKLRLQTTASDVACLKKVGVTALGLAECEGHREACCWIAFEDCETWS